MFTLRELKQIRKILDYSILPNDVSLDNFHSNDAIIKSLRDKVCDLMTLKSAWNKGKRIEEESDLLI